MSGVVSNGKHDFTASGRIKRPEVCDCGHPPTNPSEFIPGYSVMQDEQKKDVTFCNNCMSEMEVKAFSDPKNTHYFGYITENKNYPGNGEYRYQVTTWTGAVLGPITYYKTARVGFASVYEGYRRPERWFVTVKGPDGRWWKGQGPGPGMYVRLRLKGGR